MKSAFASPLASRTRFPELEKVPPEAEYVPGATVCEARSGVARTTGAGALMSLNAVTRSVCAVFATVSAICCMPDMVTEVLPVNEDPGNSPTLPPALPLITVGPVLVTVVAAKTAKVVVLPGRIVGATADDVGG